MADGCQEVKYEEEGDGGDGEAEGMEQTETTEVETEQNSGTDFTINKFETDLENPQEQIDDEVDQFVQAAAAVGGDEGGEMIEQEFQTYDENNYNNNEDEYYDPNAGLPVDTDVETAADADIYGIQDDPADQENRRDYRGDENFEKLTQFGINELVAGELVEMFEAGIMKYDDLEERTLELIKSLQADHGCYLLNQFRNANLLGIQNASAYLGSLIKNFKERVKRLGPETAVSTPLLYGPPKDKIQEIMERTGYSLEVTIGQRKYGGPPPGYEGPVPSGGCEVYVGKIPKDVYEDELIPLFEKCGTLYDLRLMMDPITGTNKGYAFATYMKREDASEAAKKYEGHAIKPGKHLRVNVSVANTRLFVGNIPKSKSREDILEEFSNVADIEGLSDVIVYPHPEDPDKKKNRGFCFLEFAEHKSASQAKRRLSSGRIRPWNCDLVVDWAEPLEEPDADAMSQVKAIYIKNLKESCTEEQLKEEFQQFGEVEKVKKVKDYAFVHFDSRENALKGKQFQNVPVEVSLAKPQSDSRRRAAMNRVNRGSRGGPMQRGGMQGGSNYQQYDYSSGAAATGYGGYGYNYNPPSYDYSQNYDYSGYTGYGQAPGGYNSYDYSQGYTYGYGGQSAASNPGYGAPAPPPPRGSAPLRGGRGARPGSQSMGVPRGGGSRGGLVPTPSRGGGRGNMSQQRGPMRGGRGARGSVGSYGGGGMMPQQGRGGGRGGLPIKRKMPGGMDMDAKRRNEGNGAGYWAAAPGASQMQAAGQQDWSQDNFSTDNF